MMSWRKTLDFVKEYWFLLVVCGSITYSAITLYNYIDNLDEHLEVLENRMNKRYKRESEDIDTIEKEQIELIKEVYYQKGKQDK